MKNIMETKCCNDDGQILNKQNIDFEKVIDFSININPMGCSPRINSVLSFLKKEICTYHDDNFINALSNYHDLPQNNFLAGNGAKEFLYHFPKVFRPKMVLVIEPVFRNYECGYQKPKGRIFYKNIAANKTFAIRRDDLFKELDRGYRALYITNPLCPAGKIMPRYIMDEIIKYSQKKGIKVFLDETSIDYHEDHSMKDCVNENENLIILRSMSNFFALPGLQVGYIISHPNNIEKIKAYKIPGTISSISQLIAEESLKDTAYIQKSIRYLNAARDSFVMKLNKFPFFTLYHGNSNFILVKINDSDRTSVNKVHEKLLKAGIIIQPCENIRGLGDGYFRIAVKKKNENNRLVSELRKLKIS